jgi:hypothetical protein
MVVCLKFDMHLLIFYIFCDTFLFRVDFLRFHVQVLYMWGWSFTRFDKNNQNG